MLSRHRPPTACRRPPYMGEVCMEAKRLRWKERQAETVVARGTDAAHGKEPRYFDPATATFKLLVDTIPGPSSGAYDENTHSVYRGVHMALGPVKNDWAGGRTLYRSGGTAATTAKQSTGSIDVLGSLVADLAIAAIDPRVRPLHGKAEA